MHVHVSALFATVMFAQVLMMGILWRLIAAHLIGKSAEGSLGAKFGRAMVFAY